MRRPTTDRRDRAGIILGVVSTFPPREDGIATFTRDLLDAVCGADSRITARIAAITDPGAYYAYPRQVRWEIEPKEPTAQDEKAQLGSRAEERNKQGNGRASTTV